MKKYNTIINYIEPTKILQRVTVDTFNNTYPLGHEYEASYITYANTDGVNNNGDYPNVPYATITPPSNIYKDIYNVGETIALIALKAAVIWRETGAAINATVGKISIKEGNTVLYSVSYNPEETRQGSILGNYTVQDSGNELEIWYDFTAYANPDNPDGDSFSGTIFYGTISRPINTLNPIAPPPRIQLNAVCKRIFEGSLGRRETDPVRFHLDSDTEAWFSQITAPEYCFTRSTLYDVLMEIGGTKEVNAVPRLLWNEETNAFDTITFVKQGDDTDEYTLPYGVELTGEEVDISADEYCEEFDSYAENIVNTLDARRGSVIEPCYTDSVNLNGMGFMAPVSEDLAITDNTSIIRTSKPIYRILKLYMTRGASYNTAEDITPYLFEAAEYDNLTSYSGSYPYAKEWALRYEQGDNKITGLCFKAEQVNELGDAFTKMAIINIIKRVMNVDYTAGICNLGFHIVYIPFYTARVTQRKPTLDWKGSGTATYNQGGNVLEADYYGNHLKNYLAKIGNPIKKYTFRLRGAQTPPTIGQVFYDEDDDELLFISQVDKEKGLLYTLVTIWCTRNVNRLYTYTAMNSRRRQYEIDEKMSVDRHLNISENIYIGDNVDGDSSIEQTYISSVMGEFWGMGEARNYVSAAIVRTMTDGENNDPTVTNELILPVTCAAFGNSLYFGFRFEDNYSVGIQSVASDKLGSAKRLARAVPYGDDNGQFEYLYFSFNRGADVDKYSYPENKTDVPAGSSAGQIIDFTSYGRHGRIPVFKDSRDIIHMNVQEHFIATRKTIIIGSELAFCNRLIRGTSEAFGIAFLPYRLNVQRENLTLQSRYIRGTVAQSDITISERKATIRAFTNTSGAAAKSWAIYNKSNNRLVIGENMNIAANGQTKPIVFNF